MSFPLKSSTKVSSAKVAGGAYTPPKVHVIPLIKLPKGEESKPLSKYPISKFVSPSSKIYPDVLEKVSEPTDASIYVDSEVSAYRKQTGVFDSEPFIILQSEYVPTYNQDKQIDLSLSLKEKALLVTAKNACLALSGSVAASIDSSKMTIIDRNKSDLLSFVDFDKNTITSILIMLQVLYGRLKIQNYSTAEGSTPVQILSQRHGTDLVSKYTSSKVWQQFLLNFKKSVISHTPQLTAATLPAASEAEKSPILLSGVDEKISSITHAFMNFYDVATPSTVEQLIRPTGVIDPAIIADNAIKAHKAAYKKLYIDVETSRQTGITKPAVNFVNGLKGFRDISLLATLISKESKISKRISETQSTLSTAYGYQADTAPAQSLFDYIIGNFSKSSWDVPTSPTGQGKSLSSLGYESVVVTTTGAPSTTKRANVLTFETSFSDSSNITPGADYYVESCLSTTDGNTFNTSNLKRLREKLETARNTSILLDELVVSSPSGFVPQLNDKFTSTDLIKRVYGDFDFLRKIYAEMLPKLAPGEIFPMDYSSLDEEEETYTIKGQQSIVERLTAGLIKICVVPPEAIKDKVEDIRAILFLLAASDELDVPKEHKVYVQHQLKLSLAKLLLISKDEASSPYKVEMGGELFSEKDPFKIDVKPDAYIASIYELFDDSTVWSTVKNLMNQFSKSKFYAADNSSTYSKIKKTIMMMTFFDFLSRVIASMTADNVSGIYESSISLFSGGSPDPGGGIPAKLPDSDAFALNTAAWRHDDISTVIGRLPTYFTKSASSGIADRIYVPYLEVTRQCLYEETEINKLASAAKGYITDLLNVTIALDLELQKESSTRLLKNFNSYYIGDDAISESKKLELLNMSLSVEQLLLHLYIVSEYKDRITKNPRVDSAGIDLSMIPGFVGFPPGYESLLPMNDSAIISHHVLSSFFSSEKFLPVKSNNKKILSVGIPQGLMRRLRDNDNQSFLEETSLRENIVRLKIFRLNRLVPEVVFKPQEFMFQMNRFPTRVLSNWNPDLLKDDQVDLLKLPTKVVTTSNLLIGQVFTNTDYSSARLALGPLTEDEFMLLYKNHATSFILEEYLRWFTDTHFDESRYYNYAELRGVASSVIDPQMAAVYSSIASRDNVPGAVGYANFKNPDGSMTSKTVIDAKNSKGITLDMTQTLKTYLTNETLLLPTIEYKRRASYPKKFDRTFCVIVDPDDFEIDAENSTKDALNIMKARGIVIENSPGSYFLRDSTQDDVAFDDYFVTVEPYNYVKTKSGK